MKEPSKVDGINNSGIACPVAAPKLERAWAFVKPAFTKRIGKIIETSEVASEFAVRIAVIGAVDFSSGKSSPLGFTNLFFLTKKTMVARVKENIYETKTAMPE